MERTAEARWDGDLRSGQGTLRLGSGAFNGSYSFGTRFENSPGTNPEELIAAAAAGCFSMALSVAVAKAGHRPERIETMATIHLEKVGEGFSITRLELNTRGRVAGLDQKEFERLADDTGKNCIVSRALAMDIRVQAQVEGA